MCYLMKIIVKAVGNRAYGLVTLNNFERFMRRNLQVQCTTKPYTEG